MISFRINGSDQAAFFLRGLRKRRTKLKMSWNVISKFIAFLWVFSVLIRALNFQQALAHIRTRARTHARINTHKHTHKTQQAQSHSHTHVRISALGRDSKYLVVKWLCSKRCSPLCLGYRFETCPSQIWFLSSLITETIYQFRAELVLFSKIFNVCRTQPIIFSKKLALYSSFYKRSAFHSEYKRQWFSVKPVLVQIYIHVHIRIRA